MSFLSFSYFCYFIYMLNIYMFLCVLDKSRTLIYEYPYIYMIKMVFKYTDGEKVRDIIVSEYNSKITLRELGILLRKTTDTMQTWWIKQYTQDMVLAGLIRPDGDHFIVENGSNK